MAEQTMQTAEVVAKTGTGMRHTSSKTAPGPRGGNWLLGSAAALRRAPLEFPLLMARRYGPVVRTRLLLWPTYLIAHPDGIKQILQANHKNYDRNLFLYQVLRQFFGEGLATASGPNHLQHRRLMQPPFHRASLVAFGPLMTGAINDMLLDWQTVASQAQTLGVHGEMIRLTLKILGQCLFTMDLTAESNRIGASVTSLLADLSHYVFVPFPPLGVPTPRNRRMQENLKTLNAVVGRLIADRRRTELLQDDLLSMLMAAKDVSGQGLSDEQLRDEMLTLIFAGSEAPAHTLAFALYLLSQHPEVEQRLHTELDRVLNGQRPTVQHLQALPYLSMVLDETLRLYPAGGTLPRRAISDDEICGYHVPAKSLVFFNAYVTHRLPEFWPDPERFDPERFTPELVAARHPFSYVPFSGGPHLCLGKPFARLELALTLAMVVQRFQLSLVPGRRVEPRATIIIRPSTGVEMLLHPRS